MGKYWITHVRMKEKRVEHVKAFMRTIEGLLNPSMYDRDAIIKSIDNNDKWYTCSFKEKRGAQNIWIIKEGIHVIKVSGERFIRTDRRKIEADNLGELPSF